MTPSESTKLFYLAMLDIVNWRNIEPHVVAQSVQRSKFADGSNYLARVPRAKELLTLRGIDEFS